MNSLKDIDQSMDSEILKAFATIQDQYGNRLDVQSILPTLKGLMQDERPEAEVKVVFNIY